MYVKKFGKERKMDSIPVAKTSNAGEDHIRSNRNGNRKEKSNTQDEVNMNDCSDFAPRFLLRGRKMTI